MSSSPYRSRLKPLRGHFEAQAMAMPLAGCGLASCAGFVLFCPHALGFIFCSFPQGFCVQLPASKFAYRFQFASKRSTTVGFAFSCFFTGLCFVQGSLLLACRDVLRCDT